MTGAQLKALIPDDAIVILRVDGNEYMSSVRAFSEPVPEGNGMQYLVISND